MNAYELADYLEKDFQIQEAVIDMLCQQADLIKQASQFIQEQGLERQWIIWSQKASEK